MDLLVHCTGTRNRFESVPVITSSTVESEAHDNTWIDRKVSLYLQTLSSPEL